MKTKDSLGGQNSHRRVSGARSSRALSTIFHKLRKLDREIGAIDEHIRIYGMGWVESFQPDFLWKRAKLDEKRKQIRQERKGHEH